MEQKEILMKNVKNIIQQLLEENYSYYFIKSRLDKCGNIDVGTIITGSSYAIHGILDGEKAFMANMSGAS